MKIVFQHADSNLTVICNFAFKMIKIGVVYLKGQICFNDGNFFRIGAFYGVFGREWNDGGILRVFFPVDFIDERKQELGRTVSCFLND